MGDGHLGKCKICTKKDVSKRYYSPESRQKIIDYEKKRFQDPERKKKLLEYTRKMRRLNRGKFRARNSVYKQVKSGILIKTPCEICGKEKVEAHHTDYRKPLQINWLCRKHHMEIEGKKTYLIYV